MLYKVPVIGTGTKDDPRRPEGSDDVLSKYSWAAVDLGDVMIVFVPDLAAKSKDEGTLLAKAEVQTVSVKDVQIAEMKIAIGSREVKKEATVTK